jgi:hypothetical protein
MAAGFCARRIDEGEAREHAVSHELEHLAAMPAQRRRQRFEYVVEHFNENGARRRVGDRREPADVGVPENGANALDGTALDHPGVNALAGIAAEIRGEEPSSHGVLGIRDDRQRYRRQHRFDQMDVVVAEAVGVIGREGEAEAAVGERLRRHADGNEFGEIVGASGDCQLLEYGEVAPRPAARQPAAQAQRQALSGGGVAQVAVRTVPQVLVIGFAMLAR